MALTISKLKMWKDPGYTRGCLEVPPAGSKKLPATPDYELAASETLRPHKGSTLTELHLPLSFTECFDMSYLYIEASDGKGSVSLFGWIDSITQRSTSAEGITILWSVDWWRSYSGSVTWGAGRIKRCSDATRKRPVTIQPRYRTASKVADIESTDGMLWIIIAYRQSSSARYYLIFPVQEPGTYGTNCTLNVGHIGAGVLHKTGMAPSLLDVMSGALPYVLGIASTSIDGAWISPVNPLNTNAYYISGTTINCHYQNYDLVEGIVYSGTVKYAAIITKGENASERDVIPFTEGSISASGETDDVTTYALTDCYGNIVGTSPYGLGFTKIDYTLDAGNVSCSLKCTFNTSTGTKGNKTSEGMTVTIPLPSIPISSNAYSDYVYSGQRDYEMQYASLQNEQTAVHGLSGAIGGAVIGAVLGSVVPGAGTAAGAAAGAAAGGVSGVASAGINYAVDEFIYKDKFQDLEDKKYANQTGNLMIPGDGFGWIKFNMKPQLITLTADSVFQSELAEHISQEGYPCDSPVSSVSTFITSGGALQITNLTITGSCPPVAKRTIKALLEGGIRIIERNPSGVAP